MGLSSRTYHCLKNAGYLYVHDIAGLDSVADGINEVGEVYVHPDP